MQIGDERLKSPQAEAKSINEDTLLGTQPLKPGVIFLKTSVDYLVGAAIFGAFIFNCGFYNFSDYCLQAIYC